MNANRKTKPFGTWPSPVTAEIVAGKSLRTGLVQGHGDAVFWSEGRPSEQGRVTIMKRGPDGNTEELLPPPYSARSRVHEYGGGEFLAAEAGLFFVNAADQDVYCRDDDGQFTRVTDAPGWRFADFSHDEERQRLIAVGELHRSDHDPAPLNALVSIALNGEAQSDVSILAEGADFYACPRLSPDGGRGQAGR